MGSFAGSDDVFRSRFNRVLAVIIWAIDLFVLVTSLVVGEPAETAGGLVLFTMFTAGLVYALLWRPSVAVSDDGVTLVNVTRTIVIPWAALIDVDTRFALSLRTPRASYSAWAAPAPGRSGLAMARRAERRHGPNAHTPTVAGRSRPGDLITTESGEAAYLVRERWNSLVESGAVEPGVADSTPVAIHWHWFQDAALVILAIATAIAVGWL
ncbi:MAG: hypothetical protein JWM49_1300 [Microbacteriaceae bacterium]|jgi:hypothetical protein|nr:hypothetical protein [Microbacteriaceae bacterium]